MSEYDFAGGTVTMTVPYETAQKFIELLEKDFGDELFALGNEFCVGKDGHTAKYLCVEVDGVGGFYNNFKEWEITTDRSMEETVAIDDEQEGEWIRSSPFTDTMECSLCGYNIYSEEIETPYCPWCGKRLKGKYDNGTDD